MWPGPRSVIGDGLEGGEGARASHSLPSPLSSSCLPIPSSSLPLPVSLEPGATAPPAVLTLHCVLRPHCHLWVMFPKVCGAVHAARDSGPQNLYLVLKGKAWGPHWCASHCGGTSRMQAPQVSNHAGFPTKPPIFCSFLSEPGEGSAGLGRGQPRNRLQI